MLKLKYESVLLVFLKCTIFLYKSFCNANVCNQKNVTNSQRCLKQLTIIVYHFLIFHTKYLAMLCLNTKNFACSVPSTQSMDPVQLQRHYRHPARLRFLGLHQISFSTHVLPKNQQKLNQF